MVRTHLPALQHVETAWLLLGPAAAILTVLAVPVAAAGANVIPPWALALTLVALLLGVPHGAVDHLALARRLRGTARVAAAVGYLALATASSALVVLLPVPAFIAVIGMSVWHFGSGDVETLEETAGLHHADHASRTLHILAAGAVPLLLPLTSPAAGATLALLEPRLTVLMHTPALGVVRGLTLLIAVTVVAGLAGSGQRRAALELALLVALGLLASPLLAFAVYFAAWHAARHTLRLALDPSGQLDPALLRSVLTAGLPSLIVASVAATVAVGFGRTTSNVFWLALAAVWGLTVPHMLVVADFGRRRRCERGSRPMRKAQVADLGLSL